MIQNFHLKIEFQKFPLKSKTDRPHGKGKLTAEVVAQTVSDATGLDATLYKVNDKFLIVEC